MMTRTTTNWTNNNEQWRNSQTTKTNAVLLLFVLFVQFVVVRSVQSRSHSDRPVSFLRRGENQNGVRSR